MSDGVRVFFFNSAGDTVSTLKALSGEINEQTNRMIVSGTVVLVSQDSTRLETDTLQWDRETERITGDGQV